jgi:outer membrane lipoprotein LolB
VRPALRGVRSAFALLLICAIALTGCAVVRQPSAFPAGELLSGRLSVRVDATASADARSMSAAFEREGDPGAGRFGLVSPLGSLLAQARWQPGQVVLATPQGETRFADLDSLTREMLGEPLPVAALFDWLHGRPWRGAVSTATQPPAEPGFEQLGWSVNLARFDEAWVSARREQAPVVTVRAKLDRP